MQHIEDWIFHKKKISECNIEIGKYRDEIGKIKDLIGKHKDLIGKHKDLIGEERKKISENENGMRETPYYWTRQWIQNNQLESLDSYDDSLSHGQFDSKVWLVKELSKLNWSKSTHIEIIGGWFGYPMIEMLESFINIKQIDFYEIDKSCETVLAQHITNFKPDYKIAIFGDYFERKEIRRRQLIINTSSEHMPDIAQMKHYYKDYPEPPYVAIQSNNYTSLDEHINCVQSADELVERSKLRKVFYAGENELERYTRYMVIGQW